MHYLNIVPSLLFTPGTQSKYFDRAYEIGAGGVILDLEDGVGAQDKDKARNNVIEYMKSQHNFTRPYLRIIRINPLSTTYGLHDLLSLIEARVFADGLSIPKINSGSEIKLISDLLKEKQMSIPLIAQIETHEAVVNLEGIVNASPDLQAIAFGAADYSLDQGNIPISYEAHRYARIKMVFSASKKGLGIHDSPFFDIHNTEGLIEETIKVKDLGFTGKLAIHPNQIPLINSVFAPSEKELARARNIVKTFEAAKGNACQFEGQMIDVPIYEREKQILNRAQFFK
ncbi:MAG: CoA ester lyase [Verrucomicrobia bacterium]|nr:CoA ester lyase [Verrucomicrobiota bacterium]